MKNIHILPTDKPSRLHNKNGQLGNYPSTKLYIEDFKGNLHNSFHIYITSDEEIKEGDWFLDSISNTIHKSELATGIFNTRKKIILTTDQELIKDAIQAIDDEFLQWFVINPSCKFVEWSSEKIEGSFENWKYKYGTVIPQEEPKQQTLEEVAENYRLSKKGFVTKNDCKDGFIEGCKQEQERSYSEEEVITILYCFHYDLVNSNIDTKEEWFEQFKKK